MKFTRFTARNGLLDHRRNENISEEFKVDPIENKLEEIN
jgi:hypothetical protein